MSTQLIGFSIGGIARRFLVQPPSMSMFPSCHVMGASFILIRVGASLAAQLGDLRIIQHAPCANLCWYGKSWGYFP